MFHYLTFCYWVPKNEYDWLLLFGCLLCCWGGFRRRSVVEGGVIGDEDEITGKEEIIVGKEDTIVEWIEHKLIRSSA